MSCSWNHACNYCLGLDEIAVDTGVLYLILNIACMHCYCVSFSTDLMINCTSNSSTSAKESSSHAYAFTASEIPNEGNQEQYNLVIDD